MVFLWLPGPRVLVGGGLKTQGWSVERAGVLHPQLTQGLVTDNHHCLSPQLCDRRPPSPPPPWPWLPSASSWPSLPWSWTAGQGGVYSHIETSETIVWARGLNSHFLQCRISSIAVQQRGASRPSA